jgi:hypothetical protein
MKKVIFTNGEVLQPFYDSGKFGTTEAGIFIPVESDADGVRLVRFLKSKLISYIVGATKWSNFETNKQIFSSIPHPKELPDNFTDEQVYAYFGLTPDQISRIETNQRGPGLSNYVELTAPIVELVPTAESSTDSTAACSAITYHDYKKMTVADLKQLCKDKKIRGITGRSKSELIAMLIA